MLETSDLKYLDSLNQTFKSQESRFSSSSFASHINSAQCRIIEIPKLLYQGITLLVFRVQILMVLLACVSRSTKSNSLPCDRTFCQLWTCYSQKKEILKAVWATITATISTLFLYSEKGEVCWRNSWAVMRLIWFPSGAGEEFVSTYPPGEVSWCSRISIVCDLCIHTNEPFCTTLKCWNLLVSALMHLKYVHLYSPSVHHL